MKKAIAVALLFVSVGVYAGEKPGNPDRFPSIGLNYSGYAMSGDGEVTASGLKYKQDIETAGGLLALDTRIPVSDSLTFNAMLGIQASESTADETIALTGGNNNASGLAFNVGMRYYIK